MNTTTRKPEKITLTLDSSIIEQAKRRQAKIGGTFSGIVERLLSDWLKSYDLTEMALEIVQLGQRDPKKIAEIIKKKLNSKEDAKEGGSGK